MKKRERLEIAAACLWLVLMLAIVLLTGCAHTVPMHVHNGRGQPPTEVNVNLPPEAKGTLEIVTDRLSSAENWPLWVAVFLILVGSAWLSWRRWSKPK